MGYTIRIIDKGMKNKTIHDEAAPADGAPTDHTNERWPSYSGWADYAKDCDLSALWQKILKKHPGRYTLLQSDLRALQNVSYSKLIDYNKARHDWLMYWLRKFKQPVIVNS